MSPGPMTAVIRAVFFPLDGRGAGRPSSGQTGLVTQSIYPNGHDASFGYLEMTLRF